MVIKAWTLSTSKGVIQGYRGVAAVDAKHQIVVGAEAHGSGSEQALLVPVVKAIVALMAKGEKGSCSIKDTLITADAGYHSEGNLAALDQMNINALIADNLMRGRDERFADQAKYQTQPDPLDHQCATQKDGLLRPDDFNYDAEAGTCHCPARRSLHSCGTHCTVNGRTHHKF